MLLGAVALAASFIFYPVGQALAWVAGIGLGYVIIVVEWFGNKSWSAVNLQLPFWVMLGMYLLLAFVIARSEATKQSQGLK